ncbi:hypothetical protein [Streptomyces sp. NBC_00557]|uniref:hypothetical protein n=1 Tax=Streptomyces sp. NBC_00557 TaxID=2975776 RepID=UPI002E80779E|nr:hypothetical protein [Streptomyces sp. NBC_00557]WUC32762.1 hypothetical protein OG956_00230 [Streptomyces sp. NBC_00557]
MDFDLVPPGGAGPLRIGMTRQAAGTALESLRDLSLVSASDRPGQHVFRPSGLVISIHCVRGVLEAVQLGRPSLQTDRVLFRGVDVFALAAREVVQRVGEFTAIEEDPDDAASFIAPDLLLRLLLQLGPAGSAWVPGYPDDWDQRVTHRVTYAVDDFLVAVRTAIPYPALFAARDALVEAAESALLFPIGGRQPIRGMQGLGWSRRIGGALYVFEVTGPRPLENAPDG